MSYAKISQKEARRLRARVEQLESERNRLFEPWTTDYPRGVHLWNWTPGADLYMTLKTARRLGHAIVVTHVEADRSVRFYAVKP